MQDNLVKRMNKVVKKIGKKDMQRSEKIVRKEIVKVEDKNQDQLDQLYYLGLDLAELEKQQAMV